MQVKTSPQKGVKHLAQGNQQPPNEIADAVRNAGAILIYFLAFLATNGIAIVVLIDRELWPVMLAFAVLVWLVAFATARILPRIAQRAEES